MDFDVAIGYGTDQPDFWISRFERHRAQPRGPHRLHRRRATTVQAVLRRRRSSSAPRRCTSRGCGRSTTSTTTARSCATPTATTSRRSATAARAEPGTRRSVDVGEGGPHPGPTSGGLLGVDDTAVRLDQAAHDVQAQAGAVLARPARTG